MSLIQDALKRQLEEMNRQQEAAAQAAPKPDPQAPPLPGSPAPQPQQTPIRISRQAAVTPPPIPTIPAYHPPSPSAEIQKAIEPEHVKHIESYETEPKKRLNVIILTILLLVLIIGGLGFYLGKDRLMALFRPKEAPPAPVAVTPPEAAPADPAASAIVPETATTQDPGKPLPEPAVASVTSSIPTPEVVADPIAAEPQTPPPPPKIEPVIWPPIKLTGMVKLGDTAAALIDGKVVSPGEVIEDVELISVTKKGAVLRYQGEERLLRVGETAR